MSAVSGRALRLDALAVAAVGGAAVATGGQLVPMYVATAAAVGLRMALWARLPAVERGHGPGREIAVFAVCAVAGGFNDWNTVDRHGVYRYLVESDLAPRSTIPSWMWLYWGLILRLMLTLTRWRALYPPEQPRNTVWLGFRQVESARLKVALEIALVLLTRQAIYRLYLDPVWSWLPFFAALALAAALLRFRAYEWKLVALALLLGPLAEGALIRLAGLHRYELGVFLGVPMWIILWWALGVVILQDWWGRMGNAERADPYGATHRHPRAIHESPLP